MAKKSLSTKNPGLSEQGGEADKKGQGEVVWKTFNDKERLFSVPYPSSWTASSVAETCVEHNKNKFKIFKNLIYEVENEYVLLNVSSKDLNAYKINFDKYDKLTPSRKKFFERRGFFRTSKKALSSSKRMISILSKDMKEVGFLDNVGGRFMNIYTKFTVQYPAEIGKILNTFLSTVPNS